MNMRFGDDVSIPTGGLLETIATGLGLAYNEQRSMYDYSLRQNEIDRKLKAQKLWDYYAGNSEEILKYLHQALAKTFSADDIAEFQLLFLLIVKRIIDRLAMAYKLPAERYILNDDASNENYQELLESSNINAQAKRWQRYSKLCDTIGVQVVWRDKKIQYDIFTPHRLTVREDPANYLKASEVIFQQTLDGQLRSIYWSATEQKVLDKKGRTVKDKANPDGVNPYGVLPFVVLHSRECERFWGEGDSELVNLNEKINVLLVNAFHNSIMQGFGQPVSINMDLKGGVKTGPKHVITANNVMEGSFPPSFHFEQPNPAIKEAMEQIDWLVKAACINRGLPPSSVSTEVKAQSGAAKAIDSIELVETREDDIEILRPFEKELFLVTVAVWNYENPTKQISPDSNFCIDFEEMKLPESELDQLAAKQLKKSMGLWTPIDDIIDEDEGIDEAQALELVQHKIEINRQIDEAGGFASFGLTPKTAGNQPGNGPVKTPGSQKPTSGTMPMQSPNQAMGL